MSRGMRLLILLAVLLGTAEIVLVLLRILLPDQSFPVLLAIWGSGVLVVGVFVWRRLLPPED